MQLKHHVNHLIYLNHYDILQKHTEKVQLGIIIVTF